jgi:hypothetical protein
MNKNVGVSDLPGVGQRRVAWDLDGLEWVDFALGTRGALAGHPLEPQFRAIESIATPGGITATLPKEELNGWASSSPAGLGSNGELLADCHRRQPLGVRLVRALTDPPTILLAAPAITSALMGP